MKRYKSIKEEIEYIDSNNSIINRQDIHHYEFDYEDDLDIDPISGEYYFDDEEMGIRHYYDPNSDEWYYYEMQNGVMTKEVEQGDDEDFEFIEEEIVEGFTTAKPKPEAGYEVKKVKKAKKGGGAEVGWVKTKKKGVVKKKTKLSKSQLKTRAKKAAKTKKADKVGQRKAIKKSKKTRKLNK